MSDSKYFVAYHSFDTTAATIPGFDVTAALRQSVSDKTMALNLMITGNEKPAGTHAS
jgi:hypothetical protein